MMTEEKVLAGTIEMLKQRLDVVSHQYNQLYEQAGNEIGMPEWYNTHDYSSGAWKAKFDALTDEFNFLNKLLSIIDP